MLGKNAEGADIAFRLFGSFTSNLDSYLITREQFAATLDEHGFTKAAASVREAEYVSALSQTVSNRGKPIANQVAKGATPPKGQRVVIDVLPIPAAKDAIAFEVKRGEWSETEECGTELKIGARVVATSAGIYALPPRAEDGGQWAEDADCMKAAKMIVDEAFRSVGYVNPRLVSVTLSRVYAEAGFYGRFLCDGARLGVEGRPDTARVVALAETIRQRHFDGFNGISLNVVDVLRNPNHERQWGQTILHALAASAEDMIKQLEKDAASGGKTRAGTIADRQKAAQALLDDVTANQGILGEWADTLRRRADAIREAYGRAISGLLLELPDCFEETDPAKVAAAKSPEHTAAPVAPPASDTFAAPAPPTTPADADLSAFDL
jgi:hypothetical protein